MQVPLLDLGREYAPIKDSVDAAIHQVMAAARFINGPQVTELESEIARFCGSKYAVGVASGTDALLLSLRAAGVGAGDEVIIPCFTFFATAGAISNSGATPVFVDIDETTFNIDTGKIESAITEKTKVIMPVHLFGQSADMDAIMEIARQHKLVVIEDAAQAISAEYKGKKCGSVADFGCFSFFPTKNLGCAGDGGMVVINSDQFDLKLRMLKAHGEAGEYRHTLIGYNSRLDTMQAAILLTKLPHLPAWSEARRQNAQYYNDRFANSPVVTPTEQDYAYHIYNQYTIRISNRDALMQALIDTKIGCKVYYPIPLHLQECFQHLGYKQGDMPVAERCSQEVLSLPIFSQITDAEREFVADTLLESVF